MKEDFIREGYGEDIFWATIMDLKYKMAECITFKGVPGNFVPWWYNIFFDLKLFKLGRLEFEKILFPDEGYECCGHRIREGDPVYSVHIPSGAPLTKADCDDSYRRAYEFFAQERDGEPLVCWCHSWMLGPVNRQIFSEGSNLLRFMEDWDIYEHEAVEVFEDAWRIFGMDYEGNVDVLPRNTSLQKAMVRWLAQGNRTEEGKGILICDGDRILTQFCSP